MRLLNFESPGERTAEDLWQAELDAALGGRIDGPAAESWRELRADVRALAPPMAPEFELQLRERLLKRPATRGRKSLAWLGRPGHLAGGALATTAVIVIVALIANPPGHGVTGRTVVHPVVSGGSSATSSSSSSSSAGAEKRTAEAAPVNEAAKGHASPAQAAVAPAVAPAPEGLSTAVSPAPAPGRRQQVAASINLAPASGEVQAIATRVAELATGEGGYVESSHVQVEQTGASEASLSLRLPSAKLNAVLLALGRLAPVSSESQSAQDVTGEYDSARRRLGDVNAERQALLRALAAATTQGQIESLRERLTESRRRIAEATSGLAAVSHRASTAEVEVTVLSDGHSGSEGLTLHRGLHDAGRVATVVVVVLLITAAVFVPLALLLAGFLAGRGAWRRSRRERALDSA